MGFLSLFLPKYQILSHIIMWRLKLFAELNLVLFWVKIQKYTKFKTPFDDDTES